MEGLRQRLQPTRRELSFKKVEGVAVRAEERAELYSVGRVCFQCQKESRYSCPRCAVPYCSLACYRAHDASCTESFYRSKVLDAQRAEGGGGGAPGGEERSRLQGAVRRYEAQVAEDDARIRGGELPGAPAPPQVDAAPQAGDRGFSAAALERFLTADGSVREDLREDMLTEEERRAFRASLRSGSIAEVVGEMDAWWERSGRWLVEDLSEPTGESAFPSTKGELLRVAPLAEGTRCHGSVRLAVVDLLLSYITVYRHFHGFLDGEMAPESAAALVGTARVLGAGAAAPLRDMGHVAQAFAEALAAFNAAEGTAIDGAAVLRDVLALLEAEDMCCVALHHAEKVLAGARAGARGGALARAQMKVRFHLRWVLRARAAGPGALARLAEERRAAAAAMPWR